MKKFLAALLAAATMLTLNTAAFAVESSDRVTELSLTAVSGQPVFSDGKQMKGAGRADSLSIGTPNDSVSPNQTLYFALPRQFATWLANDRNARLTVKRTRNPKLINSIELVEKKLTTNSNEILVPNNKNPQPNVVGDYVAYKTNVRNPYLAVQLNDVLGSDEYKVEFSVTVTSKRAPSAPFYNKWSTTTAPTKDTPVLFAAETGERLVLNGVLYVANGVADGDNASVSVGKSGITIKPIKNSTNEVSFEGDATQMALLTFQASSSPSSFYAKLSTNWTTLLMKKFQNTDAVIRRFTAANIDSVGRATLSLNNPFSEYDVDPDEVYIYASDSAGQIRDVTASFTYNSDDDAFVTRTRTLTTYIISDKKVSTQ